MSMKGFPFARERFPFDIQRFLYFSSKIDPFWRLDSIEILSLAQDSCTFIVSIRSSQQKMDAAGKRPANKPWRPSSANRSQEASKVPIASSADADDIASSLSSLSLGHNQPSRLGTIPSGSSSVVLELIDIPSSYKTSDLVDIFKKFDSPMDFTIKWLTDTQARAIFKSPSLGMNSVLITHYSYLIINADL